MTRWGTVKADFLTKRTSLEGVYAAGDIVRGASLVVWAIRDGREAAESILELARRPLGGHRGGVSGRARRMRNRMDKRYAGQAAWPSRHGSASLTDFAAASRVA